MLSVAVPVAVPAADEKHRRLSNTGTIIFDMTIVITTIKLNKIKFLAANMLFLIDEKLSLKSKLTVVNSTTGRNDVNQHAI